MEVFVPNMRMTELKLHLSWQMGRVKTLTPDKNRKVDHIPFEKKMLYT